MSPRKITLDHGMLDVSMIWIVPVVLMIVTVVILTDVRRMQMKDSFERRYALRLIRLTESFEKRKSKQRRRLQQPSQWRNASGNVEGLRLDPSIYGGSDTDTRRI